jgi:hypothetical protein
VFPLLFDRSMGQPKSPFFAEGIGQHFELARDSQGVSRDLSIVNRFLDQPVESWAASPIISAHHNTVRWPEQQGAFIRKSHDYFDA